MARKLDPPPVGLPLMDKNGLTSDWHRWFQNVYVIDTTLLAITAGGTLGGSGSVLDGGRADTTFTNGSTFDMGGAA